MITRGIVEERIDNYHYRVRLPLFDGTATSRGGKLKKDLMIATICTLPSTTIGVNVGDVVFVATESGADTKAVIIGYLYCDNSGNTRCDIDARCITVDGTAILSADTYIGDVSPTEISYLLGVKANIQKQIDHLQSQIDALSGSASSKEEDT